MSTSRIGILLFPVLLLFSCKETSTEPGGTGYPAKLYSHEVLFDAAVFKQRRDDLIQRLPAGTLVFLTTNGVYPRNGTVDYGFRPSSTFFYLTGFEEPNAIAVIRKAGSAAAGSELIMFVQERTESEAQWMGDVYGPHGVVEHFGADSGYAVGTWPQMLQGYVRNGIVTTVAANLAENDDVAGEFNSLGLATGATSDVRSHVDQMRVIKSPLEIESLRRAVGVSVQAFNEAIASTEPAMYEYEVQAFLEFILLLNGCPRTAFPTIVASGPNIVTIHYDLNSRKMVSGDLAMADFGAEYGYYAADVTRTVPVNGSFTMSQAIIYDIVKSAHSAVIAAAKPGVSFAALSTLSRETIISGLVQAGVISGPAATVISSGQYRLYIPAGLGHCIGLDVHDPWPVDQNNERILREGMVLALEPHVYLGLNDLSVAESFRGVCARIEDDILITSAGCEVLSHALPSARVDIERLMRSK